MAILNPYSKTTYVNGTTPDLNAVNLNKNEQGVYDVTEKVRELAAYETNAAASAVSAASSASTAAASAAVYTDLVEDVANLTTDLSDLTTVVANYSTYSTTVVANHSTYSTTEEVVIGTYDGKPLYRASVIITKLPNNGQAYYRHRMEEEDVEKIFIGKNSHATDGTTYFPIPFPSRTSTAVIGAYADVTGVLIDTGMNRSDLSAVIWLEYTKTTD